MTVYLYHGETADAYAATALVTATRNDIVVQPAFKRPSIRPSGVWFIGTTPNTWYEEFDSSVVSIIGNVSPLGKRRLKQAYEDGLTDRQVDFIPSSPEQGVTAKLAKMGGSAHPDLSPMWVNPREAIIRAVVEMYLTRWDTRDYHPSRFALVEDRIRNYMEAAMHTPPLLAIPEYYVTEALHMLRNAIMPMNHSEGRFILKDERVVLRGDTRLASHIAAIAYRDRPVLVHTETEGAVRFYGEEGQFNCDSFARLYGGGGSHREAAFPIREHHDLQKIIQNFYRYLSTSRKRQR